MHIGGQRDSLAIDGRIARLAEAQHGVVSRAQLLNAGLGAGGVDFRLRVCDGYGIERPAVNARVEDLTVDFLWRAQRLVVEIDGHRYHGTRAAFERDRARDARLTVAGYRVVRFTYRRLARDPAAVAAIVRRLLRAAYAASSSSSRPERSASAVSW